MTHASFVLAAAKGGHLDALAFLHEHGCPWSEVSMYGLFFTDIPSKLECARYMLAHGCPCPAQDRARLVRSVARHVLLPRWRAMVKVRPYAWHWLEMHTETHWAPKGVGGKRDRA